MLSGYLPLAAAIAGEVPDFCHGETASRRSAQASDARFFIPIGMGENLNASAPTGASPIGMKQTYKYLYIA